MTQLDPIDDLDTMAATWAIRVDRGLTAGERAELDAWAADDVRRQGALIRALAVLTAASPDALAANDDDAVPARRLGRRELLWGGAVAAGFAAVGALFGAPALLGQTYATRRGELRTVTLADGSRVWLNAASRVRVDYSRDRRDIALLSGEALFDVAKDRTRPFVVRSGMVEVRAVGTSFSVGQAPDRPVEILVREGYVDVAAETAGAPPATRLRPGCRAQATQAGNVAVRHIGVPLVLQALSWRHGVLDFQDARLADAAHAFSLHADPRIVLEEPTLGLERVNGQYAANDPEAFAAAVAQRLNLRMTAAGGAIHLAR